MHDLALWRVEALALPPLLAPCARCARLVSFRCSERFRVNANGGRLDVWLLYRCAVCGAPHRERVLRRAAVEAIAPDERTGYQAAAPALVRRCAFAAGARVEVPYRVVRPSLPSCGLVRARIVQQEPCGARWDRFLARELDWPRARVARAAERGRVRVNVGARRLRGRVADGDLLELLLDPG